MSVATSQNLKDIEYFSELIYETMHIPAFYINKGLEVITSFPANVMSNLIYPSYDKLFQQLDFFTAPLNVPVLSTTSLLENYIFFKVGDKDELHGVWILGPSIYSSIGNETVHGLINDCQPRVSMDILINYYASLSVINKRTLLHTGVLAANLLYTKQLTVNEVFQRNSHLSKNVNLEENPDLHVSKNRQENFFHNSYRWEQMVMECVKEGNKENLKNYLKNPDFNGHLGILSKKSHLRSQKNLVISSITLSTRYAMEGGLHHELAYTMSDHYIQGVEDFKEALGLQYYLREVLCAFTDRVYEVKQQKYTSPINKCQSYIFKHLYEEIKLGQMAKLVNMHQNYLSALFKKEVGMSITEYILNQKVEEAKRLLTQTDYQISDIYTWLNFHDQSHFTKVFKKYTGTTPKKFKSKKGDW